MPAIIVAEIGLAGLGAITTIAEFAVSIALSMAVSAIFGKKPSGGDTRNPQDRQETFRSPIAPRNIVYGEAMLSGPLIYAQSTGETNKYLHLVIPLAGHEVEAIEDVYFGDELVGTLSTVAVPRVPGTAGVPPHWNSTVSDSGQDFDPGNPEIPEVPEKPVGTVTTGRFANKAVIRKHLGAPGQTADDVLIAAMKGDQVGYTTDAAGYSIGDTEITLISGVGSVFAGDVIDFGDGHQYVVEKGLIYPGTITLQAPGLVANLSAATHPVTLTADSSKWCSTDVLSDTAYLYVRLEYDQTVYANGIPNIKAKVKGKKLYDPRLDSTNGGSGSHRADDSSTWEWSDNWALCVRDYLASSYGLNCSAAEIDDAACIAAANISDEQVLISTGPDTYQSRYTCNGVVYLDKTPADIMGSMLTAGAGMIPFAQGKYRILAGAYRTPVVSLTIDDLRGSIQMQTRIPRHERFNAVRGTYVDPLKYWQPADFPPVRNATYVTQDDGEEVFRDIELLFTTDAIEAQRIAKIHLEKSRQGITINIPAKYTAFKLNVGDTFMLTIAHFGWTNKVFFVTKWELQAEGGVDISAQEEASECYDWSLGEATVIDPAPDTNLPNPFVIAPLTGLNVQEVLIRKLDGNYGTKTVTTFNPSPNRHVKEYVLEFYSDASGVWTQFSSGSLQTYFEHFDSPIDNYIIRAKAVNIYGASSDWVEFPITIVGVAAKIASLAATLPAPTSMTVWTGSAQDGSVNQIKVQVTYDASANIVPADILLMWASWPSDVPNSLDIISGGTGTTLAFDQPMVLADGADEILAGSTQSHVKVRPPNRPFSPNLDYSANLWAAQDAVEWRRATGFDATGYIFDPPFASTIIAGHTLNWSQISWDDARTDPNNRLGVITDGTSYEIIRWGGVDANTATDPWTRNLINCARGLEGTTPMSADGKKFYYFPAPGTGTRSILFPAANLRETSPGVWTGTLHADLKWPDGHDVLSMSAITGRETKEGWLRSNYFIPTWGGPI